MRLLLGELMKNELAGGAFLSSSLFCIFSISQNISHPGINIPQNNLTPSSFSQNPVLKPLPILARRRSPNQKSNNQHPLHTHHHHHLSPPPHQRHHHPHLHPPPHHDHVKLCTLPRRHLSWRLLQVVNFKLRRFVDTMSPIPYHTLPCNIPCIPPFSIQYPLPAYHNCIIPYQIINGIDIIVHCAFPPREWTPS